MGKFEDKTYSPMLIGKSSEAFDSDDYLYELKWDGTRCLAYCDQSTILINKRGRILNDQFPELMNLHKSMKKACVLDGEITVFHNGKPDFYALQRREMMRSSFRVELASQQDPATFLAFDLLYWNDQDLTEQPLIKRKKKLSQFQDQMHAVLSRVYEKEGLRLYDFAYQQGLEGIVAKEKLSTYQPGKRSTSWIKIKNLKDEDFVVCGYLKKEGKFLSLVLGQYDKKELLYRGHVTLGVSDSLLKQKNLPIQKQCPFQIVPQHHEKAVWFSPKLVCTVKYMEKTETGSLRQPVLKGFREDKSIRECQMER